MNAFAILGFVALGIFLAEWNNHIRRETARRAYCNGYRQAKKEEKIRISSNQYVQDQVWFYRSPDYYIPTCGTVTESKQSDECGKLDDKFMENLHNNGRAVTKIKKIK